MKSFRGIAALKQNLYLKYALLLDAIVIPCNRYNMFRLDPIKKITVISLRVPIKH